jgi:copper resistance protein C
LPATRKIVNVTRSSGCIALGFAILLVLLPQALAHAFLQGSSPSARTMLNASPTEVSLVFTLGLDPARVMIEVRDASGAQVDTGDVRVPPENLTRASVGVQPLLPGTYHVRWSVTAVDTHRTEGDFTFTIGVPGRDEPASPAPSPPTIRWRGTLLERASGSG